MQQPATVNGVQVIVVAQTAPLNTQTRYRNMTNEIAKKFNILGKAHIVMGALCIVFQIVSLGFSAYSEGPGIWIGSLFVVTGAFGIFAGKKCGKCQVVTFHVLSTISAGFAALMFTLAILDSVTSYGTYWQGAVVMQILLILLAVAEGVISIYSSSISCAMGLCCCNCGGSCCCPTDPQYQQFDNTVQPDVAQQQFVPGNQQQAVFNPNDQHFVSNPDQQQLVFNPNQQQLGLMFNPSQQQLMFNPNQQQLMSIHNQQQPMLIQKQQQPMFNLNQQQLLYNPTQPMTGFYSQQYAAQHNGHQQNVLLTPAQPGVSASLPGTIGQGTHTIDYSEVTAGSLPADTSAQPNDERSYEGLIRFSGSDQHPPQDPPPPYDDDSVSYI